MPLFGELQPWHWFVLGLCLLIIEIFVPAGFFIGISVASILMALLSLAIDDLNWEWQLMLFAIFAVVFTVLYLRVFKRFNQKTDSPKLNDRAAQLIGLQLTLEESISGQGHIQIGDTRWTLQCEGSIDAGTNVRVVDRRGMNLIVEAL